MFGHDFRAQRDPINNVTIYVPAIVDRNAAKSLATVIEGEKEYVSMPRPPFCLVAQTAFSLDKGPGEIWYNNVQDETR